jgi:hypothetical protein
VPAGEVALGVDQPSVVVRAGEDDLGVAAAHADRFLVLRQSEVVVVEDVAASCGGG